MSVTIERSITISAANRLGRRIRAHGLNADDQAQLELLLMDAFEALSAVSAVLQEELPHLQITQRLKTVGTIVDKLRRERTMALSRMRDLAGIRIVEEMTRVEQDVLVRQIAEVLEVVKPIDRRSRPSAGYRAVHLEVDCGGCFVEIQIRTGLQDQWAQVVERLGDTWGRQVRYGGDPPDVTREIIPGFPRSDLWEMVQDFATWIDDIEVLEASLAIEADPGDERVLEAANQRRELAELLVRIRTIVEGGRV